MHINKKPHNIPTKPHKNLTKYMALPGFLSPSLLIGIGLAIVDTIAFSVVKNVSLGHMSRWALTGAVLLYGATPLILLASLKYSSLTVMNLTWDLCSDILVTLVGLLVFKEVLNERQLIGVLLSIIAIILFSTSH